MKTISRDAHRFLVRRAMACSLILLGLGPAVWPDAHAQNDPSLPAQASPSTTGKWSSVMPWPHDAVHAHILPTGKIMTWPEDEDADVDNTVASLWTPSTGVFTQATPITVDRYNLYCSGHAFMPDGKLFLAGGSDEPHGIVSLALANAYNPTGNSWIPAPDMNAGRYYPTNTTLANGDVLVVAGTINRSSGSNRLPQVFQRSSWNWRDLTNALLDLPT